MRKIGFKPVNLIFPLLYIILAVFGIMFFGTRSSFYYPYNDWCDANSYFSLGKSMFNGLLPYRDVFDQKGPYLYFLYGLCYLISNKTFLGVFLMEIILGVFDVLGFFRILRLYLNETISLVLAPICLAVSVASYSFYMGGAAEEICLPCYVWGLYLILSYAKGRVGEKDLPMFLVKEGILSGFVANIKFTGLGFFFGVMLWILIDLLLKKNIKKKVLYLLKTCLWFLFGFILPFIPWLIYFSSKDGLYYWYWGYVDVNVFSYSNFGGEGPSIMERIKGLIKILYYLIQKDMIYFIFIIPGMVYSVIQGKIKLWGRLLVPVLFAFLFLGIYVGGSELPYYALPLSVFAIFGFALLGKLMGILFGILIDKTALFKGIFLALGIMVSAALVFILSMNIPAHNIKKEDHFLTKCAAIIESSGIEDPTLLNVNCLDAGLYTVAGIVPNCQWFQTQTINSDVPYEEQARYIKEGLIDFVLARDAYPAVTTDSYDMVLEIPWSHEGYNSVYYLFRKK